MSSALALLPDPRGVTVHLDLADTPPAACEGLVLPVTGRDTTLGHLVVESGSQLVPTESRSALEALPHSLGLSLTTLGLYDDLRVRAEQDALTGLHNRASLHSRLAEMVQSAGGRDRHSGLHVLLIDLDRFKAVNDTAGHGAVDDYAERAAARIRAAVSAPVPLPSGASVTVGVSVGLATWRAPMTADDLLHAADMAMYAEKRTSRVGAGVTG